MSLPALDRTVLLAARTRGHTPARDRAVAAFSRAGEHGACWLVLGAARAALARDHQHRVQWLRATATVAASYAANTAVKYAIRRPRPELDGLPPLTGTVSSLSFPSAHTTTSFCAAGCYRFSPLYLVATLFALSRLYLGVHYPSDVVAGALLGTAFARGASKCR